MAVFALHLSVQADAQGAKAPPALNWYRGNTHAHTLNSDGNATPDVVARWYREHNYQFLVITDHEYVTDAEALNRVFGARERFLLIPGQEITQWSANPKHDAAHVNAINVSQIIWPVGESRCLGEGCGRVAPASMPLSETFHINIGAILAAGGIAQVNHPNYHWSVHPEDLFDLPDYTLLEIWNGIPEINNLGGTDDEGNASPSTEALWDILLSRGKIIWGVGSDDSHEYDHLDDPKSARPGRAWIVVRAPELSSAAIAAALHTGDFYASTGVTLDSVMANHTQYSIVIHAEGKSRYLTRFIGRGGRVLAEVTGTKPQYAIKGDEKYVRASITDSNGQRAWVQPVILDHRSAAPALR